MTSSALSATSGRAESVESSGALPPRRRRRRRLPLAAAAVVVLVGAGAYVESANPHGISLAHPLGRHHAATGAQDNAAAASTATVTRRSLSQTTPVNGTLGYAGSYPVLGRLPGTITWLPAIGQVIRRGQMLYQVDGYPVVLLYGSTPAYRPLAGGAAAADVTGQDVAELNHDLVALGYLDSSAADWAWDEFGSATKAAIEKLQEHLGVSQTGALDLGRVVFLPTAARVTAVSAAPGGPASGPIMSATSTTRQVSVDLDAGRQSEVKAGDRVTVTLPGNSTTTGVVSSVGKVATAPSSSGANGSNGPGSSTPTVTVHIRPTRPADTGTLDQAPVLVTITTQTVRNVLAVPAGALLALSGGGYAVEVANRDGTRHLVSVSLGLFDDAAGLVQVTGSGLAAGQHVVVPAP